MAIPVLSGSNNNSKSEEATDLSSGMMNRNARREKLVKLREERMNLSQRLKNLTGYVSDSFSGTRGTEESSKSAHNESGHTQQTHQSQLPKYAALGDPDSIAASSSTPSISKQLQTTLNDESERRRIILMQRKQQNQNQQLQQQQKHHQQQHHKQSSPPSPTTSNIQLPLNNHTDMMSNYHTPFSTSLMGICSSQHGSDSPTVNVQENKVRKLIQVTAKELLELGVAQELIDEIRFQKKLQKQEQVQQSPTKTSRAVPSELTSSQHSSSCHNGGGAPPARGRQLRPLNDCENREGRDSGRCDRGRSKSRTRSHSKNPKERGADPGAQHHRARSQSRGRNTTHRGTSNNNDPPPQQHHKRSSERARSKSRSRHPEQRDGENRELARFKSRYRSERPSIARSSSKRQVNDDRRNDYRRKERIPKTVIADSGGRIDCNSVVSFGSCSELFEESTMCSTPKNKKPQDCTMDEFPALPASPTTAALSFLKTSGLLPQIHPATSPTKTVKPATSSITPNKIMCATTRTKKALDPPAAVVPPVHNPIQKNVNATKRDMPSIDVSGFAMTHNAHAGANANAGRTMGQQYIQATTPAAHQYNDDREETAWIILNSCTRRMVPMNDESEVPNNRSRRGFFSRSNSSKSMSADDPDGNQGDGNLLNGALNLVKNMRGRSTDPTQSGRDARQCDRSKSVERRRARSKSLSRAERAEKARQASTTTANTYEMASPSVVSPTSITQLHDPTIAPPPPPLATDNMFHEQNNSEITHYKKSILS